MVFVKRVPYSIIGARKKEKIKKIFYPAVVFPGRTDGKYYRHSILE
jgi:hypothetical protein